MLVAKHGFNIVAVEADWPDPGQKERVTLPNLCSSAPSV